MVSGTQLDAAGRTRASPLILALLLAMATYALPLPAQEKSSDETRLAAAQSALDAGKWEEAAKLAQGPAEQAAELDFVKGMALARLQRWEESRRAFESGHRKAPRDARFLVELAGVNYKQHDFAAAKRELRAALRAGSQDTYTLDFLGSIYFLEGNLEAALKYWNRIDKPRLRSVSVQPKPGLDEGIVSRALGLNAPQVLTRGALVGAEARLDNLGIFPQRRVEVTPAGGETYDFTLHVLERDGWGDSKIQGAISVLSGLPYATIYPEWYNLGHRAMNFDSLLRWDSEKRRAFAAFSTPLFGNPSTRVQTYFDARNENWNLSSTFFGAGTPLTDLNVRRFAGGAELRSVVSGPWSWSTGVEIANRSFRNLDGHTSSAEQPFFTGGTSLAYWLSVDASILNVPERRFTVEATVEGRLGRTFADGLEAFGKIRGGVNAVWLPRAKGEDYKMQLRIRAGGASGKVPLDEMFQLGVERDNDLWLRGHAGTFHGRKGAAPLGRRYFVANWEMDKNVYSNGLFGVKLGPFLDNGAIADSSGLFGSQHWLWDSGVQCKIRLLGGVSVVLIYGRDLRGGHNVFYGTTLH